MKINRQFNRAVAAVTATLPLLPVERTSMTKFSALKLGLVSLTVGLLSAVLPVGIASAVDKSVCHLPVYGGNYYCGYGSQSYRFSDGTLQVFVIGTDFSVWTRWQKNGQLSNWVSLGGKIRHTYRRSDFKLDRSDEIADEILVVMYGLDNRRWANVRFINGVWNGWRHFVE
jgi:hypothetical protein